MKAFNCKTGSAWHSWQIEGYEWAMKNNGLDPASAAESFSNLPGWPNAGKDARYRAFMEGANNQISKMEAAE